MLPSTHSLPWAGFHLLFYPEITSWPSICRSIHRCWRGIFKETSRAFCPPSGISPGFPDPLSADTSCDSTARNTVSLITAHFKILLPVPSHFDSDRLALLLIWKIEKLCLRTDSLRPCWTFWVIVTPVHLALLRLPRPHPVTHQCLKS